MKFWIFTGSKEIYFGAAGHNDYPTYHKIFGKDTADKSKAAYVARHSNSGENWTKPGIKTARKWSLYILQNKSSIEEGYGDIKKRRS